MDIKRLKARWGWATLLTLVSAAVLGWIDARVKAASGVGIIDLEFARTSADADAIIGAWRAAGVDDEMSFLMGFDYVFMASYGFALFYGALAAREAFAPGARLLTMLAFAPLAAAALDVVENALEARMMFVAADVTAIAYPVTMVKFAGVFIGLALTLAGIAGLVMGRLKRAESA